MYIKDFSSFLKHIGQYDVNICSGIYEAIRDASVCVGNKPPEKTVYDLMNQINKTYEHALDMEARTERYCEKNVRTGDTDITDINYGNG